MTASNFDASYKRIRVYEGGNVDDPRDPGGRTSRGITQRVYDGYRQRIGQPTRDVWQATEQEVRNIYRQQYWSAARCDDLPSGVDLIVFDGAVNSGVSQSVKCLQATVGVVTDGTIGNATLGALVDLEPSFVIEGIATRRMAFLHHLSTFKTFGAGWTKRVADVQRTALAMAASDRPQRGPGGIKSSMVAPSPKALLSDAKTAPIAPDTATGVTAGGLGLETANEAIQSTAGQVQAVSDVSDVLRWVFLALVIIGLGLTLYAIWRRHKTEMVADGLVQREVPA
jgi:lysozyme family protein